MSDPRINARRAKETKELGKVKVTRKVGKVTATGPLMVQIEGALDSLGAVVAVHAQALESAGTLAVNDRVMVDVWRAQVLVIGKTTDSPLTWAAPVFNIKNYKAKGDGTTDATSSIQAALTAAAVKGGAVYIPTGTFLITASLSVGSNVTVFGDGPSSQIKIGGAAHTIASVNGFINSDTVGGNANIILKDFAIVGPEDGTMTTANGADAGKGVVLTTVTDFTIENLQVSRVNIQGIVMNACIRGRVSGCKVQDIYSGNGISVDAVSNDITVEGNHLVNIADDGIGTHNGSIRTIIANNSIYNTNFGRGIDIYGASYTLVIGNSLREIGGSGSAARGISVLVGLATTIPDGTSIIGNSIIGCAQSGILVDGGADTINDTLIMGNQIEFTTDQGIYISNKVNRIAIVGNQINNSTVAGIRLEHGSTNVPTAVLVSGNQITASTSYGIVATSSVQDVRYEANYLENNLQPMNVPIPTVASAAALTLPPHSGFVSVTGTTNITSIVIRATGDRVTLAFTGALTVTDGSNLKLAGNFVTTADDTLTLASDGGTTWYETSRSVN